MTGSFVAPEAGTYTVICSIQGLRATHFQAGMEGLLEVEDYRPDQRTHDPDAA